MASILDFLNTDKGNNFVEKAGSELGESPDKIKAALTSALPMMLGAMQKNSTSPEGAANLNKALEDQKHDGSILDKLGGSLGEGGLSSLLGEGSGILGHLFGGNQDKVEAAVSTSSGMDSSKISKLLKMAAPILMGILGSQKRKDNVGQGNISSLLGSVMGSNSEHDQSFLESILNQDGNGGVIKDVAGKILGGKGGSKGLGDFFKG